MKFCKLNKRTKASIVDGKLILSFPGAQTPTLWQMDLTETKTSALEVKAITEDAHALCVKTPKGDKLDIATFTNPDDALRSLMIASKALEKAHGKIRGNNKTQTLRNPLWKKALMILGAFFICFFIWTLILPPNAQNLSLATQASPTANSGYESGVPMSVDDFLKGQ